MRRRIWSRRVSTSSSSPSKRHVTTPNDYLFLRHRIMKNWIHGHLTHVFTTVLSWLSSFYSVLLVVVGFCVSCGFILVVLLCRPPATASCRHLRRRQVALLAPIILIQIYGCVKGTVIRIGTNICVFVVITDAILSSSIWKWWRNWKLC